MAKIDGAKRFYEHAEMVVNSGEYSVALDGRAIKTPAGLNLILPSERLAGVVVDEWNAQGETIDAATMPMFRNAATVIDRVAPRRADVIQVTVKFGETDLLCYRAEAPEDLVERQSINWQPWLDWAANSLGAEMPVTTGIVPINQPAAAALRAALEALGDYQLMGVSAATAAAGSLILGLALGADAVSAEDAARLALLDDLYQAEHWGEDGEAESHRRWVRGEIEEAARFMELCR